MVVLPCIQGIEEGKTYYNVQDMVQEGANPYALSSVIVDLR